VESDGVTAHSFFSSSTLARAIGSASSDDKQSPVRCEVTKIMEDAKDCIDRLSNPKYNCSGVVVAEAFKDVENSEQTPHYGTALSKTASQESVHKSQNGWLRVFWQCFIMVFIAEWGDRTQIAMIGIHATLPLIPVMLGSTVAFGLLTLSAVIVGHFLRERTLSESTVKGVCALSFLTFALFGIHDVFAK